MTPRTKFVSFSTTKGVAAAAIHMLVDEGRLDLDRPVSHYWPAFGANGKETVTVAAVMNHQAGLQNAGTKEFAEDPLLACDPMRTMQVRD